MGRDGAACFHSTSDKARDIAKPQWDTERFGMVCTQSTTLAAWKAAIEKLCSETKRCVFPKELDTFVEKTQTFGVAHANSSR